LKVRVKVCGVTRAEDLDMVLGLGVDAVGFNFHPGSPRFVTDKQAAELVRRVPAGIATIGVFVHQSLDEVAAKMDASGVGWAQFHGDRTSAELARFPRPWYPALRPGEGETRLDDPWPTPFVLVDARLPGAYGGTGRQADWQVAASLARKRRVILAGGLGPHNLPEAVKAVCPWGVDLNSGVEASPGCKARRLLEQALAALSPWRDSPEEDIR